MGGPEAVTLFSRKETAALTQSFQRVLNCSLVSTTKKITFVSPYTISDPRVVLFDDYISLAMM